MMTCKTIAGIRINLAGFSHIEPIINNSITKPKRPAAIRHVLSEQNLSWRYRGSSRDFIANKISEVRNNLLKEGETEEEYDKRQERVYQEAWYNWTQNNVETTRYKIFYPGQVSYELDHDPFDKEEV